MNSTVRANNGDNDTDNQTRYAQLHTKATTLQQENTRLTMALREIILKRAAEMQIARVAHDQRGQRLRELGDAAVLRDNFIARLEATIQEKDALIAELRPEAPGIKRKLRSSTELQKKIGKK